MTKGNSTDASTPHQNDRGTMLQNPSSRKPKTTAPRGLKNSFFRAFSRNIKTFKLGDLLVSGGLVSTAQLDAALEAQAQTGGHLGRILIRQKALTAAQLYKTLTEQWCMRAAAAGIAILVQTVAPPPAQAQSMSLQFATTAATQAPELFGMHATRSDDIAPFRKWSALIAGFQAQLENPAATAPGIVMWQNEIRKLKNLSAQAQIDGINAFLNQIPYVDDQQVYGQYGYWHATAARFFGSGGDCKDYAIAKYVSLRVLGFSADQLRIAVVEDKIENLAHAILIVHSGGGSFVLDNQDKTVEPVTAVNRYQPIFSINTKSWWLYRA
ncbi:MAG: transglutaminase-like cysteine peptidase [Alphaproteobacteria bacterium]|nr:transglutaminase-like cysteine peptidase [Alphaproteobacteria bacterium]MDE2337061.1 transglutaminase-like cysteine peptidase [Alphaproteobacteria bacterium]